MIDANWLPAPGAAVALVALVLMFIAMAAYPRPWGERLFAVSGPVAIGGLFAMFLGIAIGVHHGVIV